MSPTGYDPDKLTNKLTNSMEQGFLEKLTVPKLAHKLFYMTINLTAVFANPLFSPSPQPDKSILRSVILYILILSYDQKCY